MADGRDAGAVRVSRLPTTSPGRTPTPARTRRQHRAALLVNRLVGVGAARQVVAVTASGYGTSYATVRTFTKTVHGWRQVFGPWPARIGYNGFAPGGAKREGD